MNLNLVRTVVCLLLASIFVACTGKSSQKSDDSAENADEVTYHLPSATEDPSSPPPVKMLATAVRSGQRLSFNTITAALFEKHMKVANQQNAASVVPAVLAQIIPANKNLNPRQLKMAYEDLLAKHHKGAKLIYNRKKTNVADILIDNRTQCYSGTYLYELIRRQRGAKEFRAGREVVIFENGHVLPGYFEKTADGSLALWGVETTKAGGGGKVLAFINQNNRDIGHRRVVDAELFAVIELLQNHLSRPKEVMEDALKATAKTYNFDFKEISDQATKLSGENLNQSLFSFGDADVPEGDVERAESGDDGTTSANAMGAAVALAPMSLQPTLGVLVVLKTGEENELDYETYPLNNSELELTELAEEQNRVLNPTDDQAALCSLRDRGFLKDYNRKNGQADLCSSLESKLPNLYLRRSRPCGSLEQILGQNELCKSIVRNLDGTPTRGFWVHIDGRLVYLRSVKELHKRQEIKIFVLDHRPRPNNF